MSAQSASNTNPTGNGSAGGLPLLYKNPVALDSKKHDGYSLNPKLDFSFSAEINAVPLNMIELPFAMRHYPIAFTAAKPGAAVAILGLRKNENLFVNKKGEWEAQTYIPAYVRRYPFIFATDEKQEQLALCIDDTKETLVKSADKPLIVNGDLSDLTKRALEFCKSYQAAALQSSEFSKALEATDILIDKSADVAFDGGEKLTLTGFRMVDEEKFRDLDPKIVADWHKKGWLQFIYAHLLSMANWQSLHDRLKARSAN